MAAPRSTDATDGAKLIRFPLMPSRARTKQTPARIAAIQLALGFVLGHARMSTARDSKTLNIEPFREVLDELP